MKWVIGLGVLWLLTRKSSPSSAPSDNSHLGPEYPAPPPAPGDWQPPNWTCIDNCDAQVGPWKAAGLP